MSSGVGDRHGRDQRHHDDGRAGGMEPVDETLCLLARSRDENPPPGERQRTSSSQTRRHRLAERLRIIEAARSPRLGGRCHRATSAAHEHAAAVLDPCPGAERQQAPAAEARSSTARSAVTAIRVVAVISTGAQRLRPLDPVTASSAIAPCAGEGTNSTASRRCVNRSPSARRSSPAHASTSASTSPASSLRSRVSTLPRIATGQCRIQGGEQPSASGAARPHGCAGRQLLEEVRPLADTTPSRGSARVR